MMETSLLFWRLFKTRFLKLCKMQCACSQVFGNHASCATCRACTVNKIVENSRRVLTSKLIQSSFLFLCNVQCACSQVFGNCRTSSSCALRSRSGSSNFIHKCNLIFSFFNFLLFISWRQPSCVFVSLLLKTGDIIQLVGIEMKFLF